MSQYDLYSKREKALRQDKPDVYIYDNIPEPLRVQIVFILRDTLGNEDHFRHSVGQVNDAYVTVVEALCREYGLFKLGKETWQGERDYINELFGFILRESNHEKVLDAVELTFQVIDKISREATYLFRGKPCIETS